MCYRVLAGAAALALAAGSHAALSASFAAGSANVDRIFEISQSFPGQNGGTGLPPTTISTVDNVEVDLVINMGGTTGLVSQRAGFEANFFLNTDASPAGGGAFPVTTGMLEGSFRFFDPTSPDQTLLVGFVSNGVGILVGNSTPAGGGEAPIIAGSLLAPGTSYFLNDPVNGSALGFPGGGTVGDAAFTLTDFVSLINPLNGDQAVARATGSFSGTFLPSSGTGVLSALAMGVFASRRRR